MDLLVIGNSMTDYVRNVPSTVLDRLGLAEGSEREDIDEALLQEVIAPFDLLARTPGGSATNCGINAAALGLDVGVLGAVGDDEDGHAYKAMLADAGVRDFVEMQPGASGRAYTLIHQGKRSFAAYLNRAAEHPAVPKAARWPTYAHTTAYTVQANPRVLDVLAELREHDVTIGLDLANPHSIAAIGDNMSRLLDLTDILFASPAELAAARPGSLDVFDVVCQKFGEHGASNSRRGSRDRRQDGSYHIEIVPTTPVNDLGTGDAFSAGIYTGLHLELRLEQVGRLGSVMGSLVVGQQGSKITPEQATTALAYAQQ